MSETNSFVESARLGIAILSGFAVVWVVAAVGLSTVPLVVTVSVAVSALLVAMWLNVMASRRSFSATNEAESPMSARQRRTVFIASNLVQAVLFSVLISVCIAIGELAYIPLVGSVIVGAHLIPIGFSFGERSFMAGGGMLVLTGVVGIVSSVSSAVSADYTSGLISVANAVVLLGVATLQLVRESAGPRR